MTQATVNAYSRGTVITSLKNNDYHAPFTYSGYEMSISEIPNLNEFRGDQRALSDACRLSIAIPSGFPLTPPVAFSSFKYDPHTFVWNKCNHWQ